MAPIRQGYNLRPLLEMRSSGLESGYIWANTFQIGLY